MRRFQDGVFNLYVFDKAARVCVLPQSLYRYKINDLTGIFQKFPANIFDLLREITEAFYEKLAAWGLEGGSQGSLSITEPVVPPEGTQDHAVYAVTRPVDAVHSVETEADAAVCSSGRVCRSLAPESCCTPGAGSVGWCGEARVCTPLASRPPCRSPTAAGWPGGPRTSAACTASAGTCTPGCAATLATSAWCTAW